jgi:rhodanese-related sulfurtransferase
MTRRVLFLAALTILIGCAGTAAQVDDLHSPKLRIAWEEFKKLHDSGRLVIVDVRDEASFAGGHIPGATSIPVDETAKKIAELKKLKKPVVTYCA